MEGRLEESNWPIPHVDSNPTESTNSSRGKSNQKRSIQPHVEWLSRVAQLV